jgi:hypothetical protein
VQPVVEKHIYKPHEVIHEKRVVNVHHHAPELLPSRIAPAITIAEWELLQSKTAAAKTE